MLVLLALRRARPAFDRRAAFFDTRFSAGWLAALAGALARPLWLGLFAFKHVDYSNELWWQFELHGEASRFLRASVGAAVLVLLVRWRGCCGMRRTRWRRQPRPTWRLPKRRFAATTPRPPTSCSCATRRCSSTSAAMAS